MYLAYADESGNRGYTGSFTYTLGCLFLLASDWPDAFDSFIRFRRFLREHFRVPVRAELKANWLVRNEGTVAPLKLSDEERKRIFRLHLRLASKIGVQAFGIVIRKDQILNKTKDPRDIAWEYLFQRLERLSTNSNVPVLLTHDEGEAALVRKLARKARRAGTAGSAFGTGYLNVPARLLLDDPVPRNSAQSYFIQLADLCAYAAFRRLYPPPVRRTVCPTEMWDELGAARYAAANQLAAIQQPVHPGIVVWPT